MNAVAAYYVVVATEEARKANATPAYRVAPPKGPSRIAALVASFSRPIRRTAASPA